MAQIMHMMEPYEVKRDIWDREEIQKMVQTLVASNDYPKNIHGQWMKARDLLLFNMMFEHATRPNEICALRFEDIDLKNNKIFINGTSNKVKKSRWIPLCRRVAKYWNVFLSFPSWLWKDSKYIFPSFGDKSKPLSAGRWKHIFREKICKPSGFYQQPDHPSHARTTSYSLRHSRATEILEEEGDIDLVAALLGHKDTRVTRGYTHFTKTRWEKMVGLVNKDLNTEKVTA